jgi:hypothetical protein
MDIKQQTQNVANQGRYGDSMLMHVNPAEVQGLASMMPLTQNPQTGQPEAFLPFLAPLLGSYAGVGLLGGSLGSAAAGAIGSGLATAIAEGDLKKGIMAGITGFGLGKVLGQVGSGADAAGKEAFAETVKGMPDANALTAQVAGDAASTAASDAATAAFRSGLPTEGVQEAIASGLTTPADVIANSGMSGAGNRFAAMNKNLLSGDTLTALSQPSAYLPIAMGEGQRGVMEAQEQFERDMAQFELDKKRKRDQLYADNPEQIPFSSPFYGASGGIVSLAEGREVPVMPTVPTIPRQPIPQVDNSFEAAMAGAQDYMYMPPPESTISRFEDPKGTEVMVENQLTGEMEGTGQFKPPSSYRPGIDAEFNYFPLSNRPATYNQNYLGNAGYGGPFAGYINSYLYGGTNDYLYGDTTGRGQSEYNQSYNPNATMSDGSPIMANVKNDFMTDINQYLTSNPYASNPYLSGDSSLLLRDDIGAASADYLEYLKNQESREQGGGDLASGGLIGLAAGKTIPEDNKGLKALAEKSPQTVRNMGFDFQAGGMMPQPQEVEQLTMAITGSIPNGDEVIDMFIQKYGNEIFMQIRESVLNPTQQAQTQGMIKGQGGGMDDEVMGMIGNQRPVAVSPGEYIVPADVVSGIGDGSSDAGAVELDDMLDRVRQERTGTTKQAPKLANVGGIMPR